MQNEIYKNTHEILAFIEEQILILEHQIQLATNFGEILYFKGKLHTLLDLQNFMLHNKEVYGEPYGD